LTNFQLIKSLVGYNVPKLEDIAEDEGLAFLKLPDGFEISVFAKDLKNPRVITFDPAGRMFVSETKAGRVVMLEDTDNDGLADKKTVILDNLKSPHGLAFYIGGQNTYLYVAETHQVARFIYSTKEGKVVSAEGVNIANLPADGRHFTRTIGFGPNFRDKQIIQGSSINTQANNKLYISVGSSCDVCVENTWKRGAILESDIDGNYTAEFAGGLRNSVFFTFHPETKEIWATEMGRDGLGDNLPPDEINIVRVAGPEHEFGARRYGWPYCYGDKVKDVKFSPGEVKRIDIPSDCEQTDSPAIEIPAHSSPLGLAFIASPTGPGQVYNWPSAWKNDLLVAYHGSWNKSEPTGYKIVKFKVDSNGNVNGVEDFISGWLSTDDKIFGRPVDLKFGPDGALYISDDAAGVIYRVRAQNP